MLKSAIIRLAKGSVIYGIGAILQRFIGFLLLPFFTSVLSPLDYGIAALVSLVGVAMSGLLNLGTGNSIGVLYYREKCVSRRSSIIWSNTLLLVVNGLCWYGIIYTAAPMLSGLMFQTDSYTELIRLSMLSSVLATVIDPLLAYLRMEEKAKSYVTLTIVGSLLSVGLSVWLVLVERRGVTGLILAGAMSQGVMLLVNLMVIGRKLPLTIDSRLFWPLIRIGFPTIFGQLAFLFMDYADRQMIERMLGLETVGVYSVGCSFGILMTLAVGAFATAWSPFFMSYVHKKEEARFVFARVMTYYVVGFGGLVVLFFAFAKPVIMLMTTPPFHEAFTVVGLVAASYMLKGCYLILLPGIYLAETPKLYWQSAIEWVAAIVNVCLCFWLIPQHNVLGAAIAKFVSYFSLPILAHAVSSRSLVVDYQWNRVAFALATISISSAIIYWLSLNVNASIMETITINIAVSFFFLGIAYRKLLTNSEREMILLRLKA